MIYIDNNEETQVVFIPRGAVKIGVAPPVSEESLSDYYTKNQVNSLLQHYPTKSEVQGLIPDVDLSGYQEKLVSSENIKTVNGVSLLGSGNVNVKVPHFVFTLDMENGKANLVEGDASHLLHLVTTSGQFTAELTLGDICVNYLTVYKGENGTATVTFDAQETYLSVILADEGVPYTDMPVQYVDKKTVLGITEILAEKQDKLVSGTSIKTVNGETLLGKGDIKIEGGSGSIPHFVFTLDEVNSKANLIQGDPDQILELALGHGQFTAMLFTGDSCVDYTSVVTDWNGTVSVNFETQEDYIFIFLESGGIKFGEDFPVQTIEKLKMWGIYDRLAEKQDKLVSGKNIKTVNGESLLGNGDITIEGGTVDADSLERAIMDSPYISAILARVENLEDRVEEIEENNNNMVSEL